MTSYRFFKMAAYSRKCTSGLPAKFRWNISIHGWDENNFRFRKTDGSHFGILFPVSILTYVWCHVIYISLLINYVVIGRSTTELWRHMDFSRWRPWSPACTSGFRFVTGSV